MAITSSELSVRKFRIFFKISGIWQIFIFSKPTKSNVENCEIPESFKNSQNSNR